MSVLGRLRKFAIDAFLFVGRAKRAPSGLHTCGLPDKYGALVFRDEKSCLACALIACKTSHPERHRERP